MNEERFLVTGAFGCIGAWACRVLVREGAPVVAFDIGMDPARLRLILGSNELDQVTLVRGDIADLPQLEQTMEEHRITHLIHLAALLIPQIKADPSRGATVNVVGTTNVFEAARRRGLACVAYASSAAVYGPDDGGGVEDARAPATLYGVYKQTNEETARVYWQDEGLGSVGLRPYVVYGPGRDTGLTAAPTLAIRAAAEGEPYRLPFGGSCQLQYAEDAARTFVAAARSNHRGAAAFNLGGPVSHVSELVAAIEAAAPGAAGTITYDDVQLPIPRELDPGSLIEVVGYAPDTPLAQGVTETLELFRRARQ